MPLSFVYASSQLDQQGLSSLAFTPASQIQVQERIVRSQKLSIFSDDSHGAIAKEAAAGINNNAVGDPKTSKFVYLLWERWVTSRDSPAMRLVYFIGYKDHLYSLAFGDGDKPKRLKKLGKLQAAMLKPAVRPAPINIPANVSAPNAAPSLSAMQPGQTNVSIIYMNGGAVPVSEVMEEPLYMNNA